MENRYERWILKNKYAMGEEGDTFSLIQEKEWILDASGDYSGSITDTERFKEWFGNDLIHMEEGRTGYEHYIFGKKRA